MSDTAVSAAFSVASGVKVSSALHLTTAVALHALTQPLRAVYVLVVLVVLVVLTALAALVFALFAAATAAAAPAASARGMLRAALSVAALAVAELSAPLGAFPFAVVELLAVSLLGALGAVVELVNRTLGLGPLAAMPAANEILRALPVPVALFS